MGPLPVCFTHQHQSRSVHIKKLSNYTRWNLYFWRMCGV